MPEIDKAVARPAPAIEPRSIVRRAVGLLRRLGPTAPLAVASAVLPGVGALFIYGRLGVIASWLMDRPSLGPVLCIIGFAVTGGVALVPTYALSALCGWTFGFPVGLATTLCGLVAAALVGYVIGRSIDGGHTLAAIGQSPKWRAVHAAMASGGYPKEMLVVSLLRVAPVSPFALTNLAMAATAVRPIAYALGTLLGMAPRTAIVVWAASRLNNPDIPVATEPWLVAVGVVATLFVLFALGWIGKAGLAQITSNHTDGREPQ